MLHPEPYEILMVSLLFLGLGSAIACIVVLAMGYL